LPQPLHHRLSQDIKHKICSYQVIAIKRETICEGNKIPE
jgi:hypothetical protein